MPRQTWDTQADFNREWLLNVGGGIRVNYSRVALDGHPGQKNVPCFRDRALGLQAALGWTPPGDTIAMFAAGFGWVVEALEDLGFTRVVAIDTSAWVQSAKDQTEEADVDAAIAAAGLDSLTGEGAAIKAGLSTAEHPVLTGTRARATRGVLAEDGADDGSRDRIKQVLGLVVNDDRIDWVVTESLLESLDDAEAEAESSKLHVIGTNVVHLVPTSTLWNTPIPPESPYNWKTLEEWKALLPTDTLIECGSYRVL